MDVLKPLLEIFDTHKTKAVFFASVFEHCRFGVETIRKVVQTLDKLGHDVQLHTHPSYCYGRKHMWRYTLPEQIRIIKDGKQLLENWIGQPLIAHRAGAYGLNNDTIAALRINGIPIDSSMFYGHPNCKLTWTKNRIVEKRGIVEVPVTGFFRDYCIRLPFRNLRYNRRFTKTDINGCTLAELKTFADMAVKRDIAVVNLFMHSYSLLRLDKKGIIPDEDVRTRLNALLADWSTKPNLKIITLKEFWRLFQMSSGIFDGADSAPCLKRIHGPIEIMQRFFQHRIAQ